MKTAWIYKEQHNVHIIYTEGQSCL